MSPQKHKKVVFVINSIQFFLSHRLPIAVQLQKDGYEVHIITPDKKPCDFDVHHFHYHKIIMSRKGMNPFIDLYTLLSLFIKFKKINPTIVHLVTIKPYLYGGIAARLAKVPVLVSAVAGLGIIF
ncbi:MAG TPA: glycosyltransferase family 1 protein, partial [Treponema sp.]|nr:glycosyltransferase family 1 protein [Treponema sp.]